MKHRKRSWLLWLVLILVVAAQFVPVARDNPAVLADFDDRPGVRLVLKRCCYDCHSNESVWPWYSFIAPVSWLVASDVHEAREKLNFSEWGLMADDKRRHALEEIWKEVEEGEMPLRIYLVMHSEARLSDQDMAILHEWTGGDSPTSGHQHND
ncbi:MAG: heme-binding domain-containing protein [Candidatus Zixiibacteriota bacterium]